MREMAGGSREALLCEDTELIIKVRGKNYMIHKEKVKTQNLKSIDLKSVVYVTHLVHVTGPLHDVLEGSLTRDIIHQEDSLKRDVQR